MPHLLLRKVAFVFNLMRIYVYKVFGGVYECIDIITIITSIVIEQLSNIVSLVALKRFNIAIFFDINKLTNMF